MNRRLRGGISAAICALALVGCGAGGDGNGDSSATPSAQAKKDHVFQLKVATSQIADVGITPLSALQLGTKAISS